jgi:hypothetical protein
MVRIFSYCGDASSGRSQHCLFLSSRIAIRDDVEGVVQVLAPASEGRWRPSQVAATRYSPTLDQESARINMKGCHIYVKRLTRVARDASTCLGCLEWDKRIQNQQRPCERRRHGAVRMQRRSDAGTQSKQSLL